MRVTICRTDSAIGTTLILVEAAAGLAAEMAFVDQLEEARRYLSFDLAADRRCHVQPDEVEQRHRPHRVTRAELHASVDCLRVESEFEHPDRGEQVREEQAVDDKAGDR